MRLYRYSRQNMPLMINFRSIVGAIPTNGNYTKYKFMLIKMYGNVSDERTRAKRGECRRHEGCKKIKKIKNIIMSKKKKLNSIIGFDMLRIISMN